MFMNTILEECRVHVSHPQRALVNAFPTSSEKAHENRLTVIRDEAEQEMTTLRQTNLRRLQELNAEIQRFEIEMKEMEEVRE